MDLPVTSITAQVCMMRATVFTLEPTVRDAMLALPHQVHDDNEDDPDDPMHICQWVWHNGEVNGVGMPFLVFIALFAPYIARSKLVEHEGLIIRMYHASGQQEEEATASAFLTTMGNERVGSRVRGTLKVNEELVTKDLADRLICMERLMTSKPGIVAQVLKITDRR